MFFQEFVAASAWKDSKFQEEDVLMEEWRGSGATQEVFVPAVVRGMSVRP